MTTLTINAACLERDYHGCGKAWAAIQDGEVVAIRYMGDVPIPGHGNYTVPAWIKAVMANAGGLDGRNLPVARGSKRLSEMAAAAQACDDCPKPARRQRYRPSELLTIARAALIALDSAAFEAYRIKCRTELAAIGDVASGIASCTEFIVT